MRTAPHPCLVSPLATLAPLPRGPCTLEGAGVQQHPQDGAQPPAHPGGRHRQKHIHCGSLALPQEKSGQGSGGHASTPGGVVVLCAPKHSAGSWAQISL